MHVSLIDACKVVKGLEAPYGNFMKKVIEEGEKPSGGYASVQAFRFSPPVRRA